MHVIETLKQLNMGKINRDCVRDDTCCYWRFGMLNKSLYWRIHVYAYIHTLYFQLPIALPIFLLVASLVILALTVYQKPQESGLGLLLIALGAPLYLLFVAWENKPTPVRVWLGKSSIHSSGDCSWIRFEI